MKNIFWRPIKNFETFYEINNIGDVRSVYNSNRYRPNQKTKILKNHINKYGYFQVTLSINGTRFLKRINRLVAESFIPNIESKPCVNHINGIKTDNRVENLEWVTYSENEIHSYNILKKSIKGNVKKFKNNINTKSKKIYCIENKITYISIKDASIKLGIHRSNIHKQINGDIQKTGGYSFILI